MAITDQEKLDIKKDVLDAIKSESQSVEELPVVDSLDGIASLPAVRGKELVSVPVSLLNKTATKYDRDAATARFEDIIEQATVLQMSTTSNGGRVVYVRSAKLFAYELNGCYFLNWAADGVPDADMYLNSSRSAILQDKVYLCGGSVYVWSAEDDGLVEISGNLRETTQSWKDSVVDLGGVVSDVDVVDGSCIGGVAVYAEDLGRVVYLFNGTYYANMSDKTAWVDDLGNAYPTKLYRTKGELWIATGSGSRLERLVESSGYRLWLLGEDADPVSFKAEANRVVLAELSKVSAGARVELFTEEGAGTLSGTWIGDGTVDIVMHGVTRRYTFDADGLSSREDIHTAHGWIDVE